MSMFSAFKGIEKGVIDSVSSGQKLSLGLHNSLLQAGNVSNYGNAALMGMGAGAAYGAVDGAFSYDGSILGGAFHGAILGGIGGAGLKFAGETYGKGAVNSKFASGNVGSFKSEWNTTNSAFKNAEGKQMSAFQTGAFKGGW